MPSLLETIAVLFSFAAVWLTVRKKVICWPVGLVGVTAYGLLFHQLRLYADMSLQAAFFVQGVYGWWYWVRGGAEHAQPDVTRLGYTRLAWVVAGLVLGAWLVGDLLSRTDAAAPHLDAFLALTSLVANGLLARKVLESWWLWVMADVLYIGLFLAKGVPLSGALYALFLLMSLRGAARWYREQSGASVPAMELA